MAQRDPELSERDFIHEEYSKDPAPFWMWFLIILGIVALLWLSGAWFSRLMTQQFTENPFLQVTNRRFSLFLWQFPKHMRVHAERKAGYLVAFEYTKKIGLNPLYANDYVVAPPETIFLFHTWDRLISQEYSPRGIPVKEFVEFLDYVKEWDPRYWSEAPKKYVELVANLPKEEKDRNLQDLPLSELPFDVRRAFQGWKNYFKEGKLINEMKPTFGEVESFLVANPQYARNYWQNIVSKDFPSYLKTNFSGHFDPNIKVSDEEIPPFLRVAIFNFLNSKS